MRAFRAYLDAVRSLVEEMAPLVGYEPGEPITLQDLHVVESRARALGTPCYLFRLVDVEERSPFPVNGKGRKGEAA